MLRLPLLLCLLLLPALAAASPALSERSPVRPGLWWDPANSGHGFDLHVSGRTAFGAWFTYRTDGTPVWYTLQGEFDAAGHLQSALLEHRWADAGYAGSVDVGTVALQRVHADRVLAQWTLGARQGAWALEPFPLSGNGSEIDHSGAWYDPQRAGYGLSVTEQGEWLALALYAYGADGRATWMFGHNGGKDRSVELARMQGGACPGCAPAVASSIEQVRASIAFDSETDLRLQFAAAPAGVAAPFVPPGQRMRMLSRPASARPADHQLARFDGRDELKQHLALAYEQPFTAIPHAVDFSPAITRAISSTNLIEAGVDEADVLKSDGRYVYTFGAGDGFALRRQLRIAEFAGDGPALVLHPSIDLNLPLEFPGRVDHALYLAGDHLVSLVGTRAEYRRGGPLIWEGPMVWADGRFRIDLFDRRDPARPVRRWGATIDGMLLGSRRIGDQLYLVHRSARVPPGYAAIPASHIQREANRALIAATPLEKLLPSIAVDGQEPRPLVEPGQVLLPPAGARAPQAEFASVTRIDLREPGRFETIAVLGGIEALHVSTRHLYMATTRYVPAFSETAGFRWPGFSSTDVHQIALGETGMRVVATGSVDGVVGRDFERAPFRFHEADGRLRLITVGNFGASGSNRLTVLEPSDAVDGKLRIVGRLPNADRPQPIGKPDEHVYGTRYVGDRLYVVTFLQTDPLYVIDLAEPEDPRITGEVELPGFSEYLHPLGEDLLLGVGLDALPPAPGATFTQFLGLKLALFDVSDPAAPRVQHEARIGQRGTDSALLRTHHAFAVLPLADDRVRVALPVRVHGQPAPPGGSSAVWQPWTHSGLYTIDVQGTGRDARLALQPPLITHAATTQSNDYFHDDAQYSARALLMPGGVVYVENGRFWYASDSAPGVRTGPL